MILRADQFLRFPGKGGACAIGLFIKTRVTGELLQNEQHNKLQRRSALMLFLFA